MRIPPVRIHRGARVVGLVALLYLFLVGVELVGDGIAGLGQDTTDQLFRSVSNPLAGLSVGILATVLAQSSSVTTSSIVALVGTGVLSLDAAVPIVMGANIGTSVTNTIVSLGSIRRAEEFRRAFAGATVHDLFNLLSVVVLLPLEVTTGLISRLAVTLSGLVGGTSGGNLSSPVKDALKLVTAAVERAAAAAVPDATVQTLLLLAVGVALLFTTLVLITRTMRVVIAGAAERSLNRVLGRSGMLGILVGVLLTVAVQSSSITTSLLIPMIGAGVLRLEAAFPVTVGANLGTTITALIAALAVPGIEGLQIALAHLLFNLGGTLLFYPVPALRRLPIGGARALADLAVRRRGVVIAYMLVLFVLLPLAGTLLLR